MQVIKENFRFAEKKGVIDVSLIEAFKKEFNENQIYCNEDVCHGFLLVTGNSKVNAYGNSKVDAHGDTYITSLSIVECKLSDNAIYRIRESNKIRYASDSIRFEKVPDCEKESNKTDAK
jgi:hypothetical protein